MKPQTISSYISAAPADSQKKLREMLTIVRSAAPKAIEGIKWGMPAFSHRRILVMFAGFKHHIGLYPTASALGAFKKELSKYVHGRGSVQFPLDKPLPKALIRKIVALRVQQEKDIAWRSK